MSRWTKEELDNMLEDVVNELDLSEAMIAEHGPMGTAPAELVRLVLEQKDKTIQLLRAGFVDATPGAARVGVSVERGDYDQCVRCSCVTTYWWADGYMPLCRRCAETMTEAQARVRAQSGNYGPTPNPPKTPAPNPADPACA